MLLCPIVITSLIKRRRRLLMMLGCRLSCRLRAVLGAIVIDLLPFGGRVCPGYVLLRGNLTGFQPFSTLLEVGGTISGRTCTIGRFFLSVLGHDSYPPMNRLAAGYNRWPLCYVCGVARALLSVRRSSIKCMFDSGVELPPMGAAQLAGLIEQNHAELMVRECRMLQLACAWADAHYLDSGSQEYQPIIQRACAWGGEGTPEVSEYCAAELGAMLGTGMTAPLAAAATPHREPAVRESAHAPARRSAAECRRVPINFLTRSLEVLRVLEQEIDSEGQQSAGRFMARDQERDALRADVFIRQGQAGLFVDSGDHPAEQVAVVRGITHRSAFADQIIHELSHEGLILFKLALCTDFEPSLYRKLPGARLRFVEHSDHRLDKWMWPLAIETN
jgi:hypothetical protein